MKNIEIERKYLVTGEFKHLSTAEFKIRQAYICNSKGKSVRVRTKNDKAFLTIKGPTQIGGLARMEFETEISLSDAVDLFGIADNDGINKIRYIIPWKNHVVEVDVFLGENEGLVIAEIELNDEAEIIELPEFLGEELTGKAQFYNAFLSRNPFKNWSDKENFTP